MEVPDGWLYDFHCDILHILVFCPSALGLSALLLLPLITDLLLVVTFNTSKPCRRGIFCNARNGLGELLLNEKGPQMRQLPGACGANNNELDDDPPDDTGICRFGLVAEFGFSLLHKHVRYHGANSLQQQLWAKPSLTRWNTCSLRISFRRALRSLTRVSISCSLPLSLLSIWPDSPMTRSSLILIPPLGACADNQPLRPDDELGEKQILWSPDSCAVKVKRPDEAPRCETTRWSLSNTSCRREKSPCQHSITAAII